MAEPITPTIDATVDLLRATGTGSAMLGTFPIRRLKGYGLLWQRSRRALLVVEQHHRVLGGRFQLSSPSEDLSADVIHHDDVVYPMKVDADESPSVEAQAYAIAVAKRPAPRAVVGVRQATHQCRFDTAAVADGQHGGAIRYGGHESGPEATVGVGDRGQLWQLCQEFGVSAVGLRPVPVVVVCYLARQIAGR
jgi:hypothetical protein